MDFAMFVVAVGAFYAMVAEAKKERASAAK